MKKRKHLIIGCGTAALSAVRRIRNITTEDDIKMVSREDYWPYSPASLPYLLSRKIAKSKIWLTGQNFFERMKVTFAREKEVIHIFPNNHQVEYRKGGKEDYDTLLIASGATPIKLAPIGLDSSNVLKFHTLKDLEKLGEQLKEKREVVIYGGGLVATELAIALLERGLKPKMVVRSRLLRRYFDEEFGGCIGQILSQKGLRIYSGGEVLGTESRKSGISLVLKNGTSLNMDLFVSCLGVKPRIPVIEGNEILIKDGIIVNDQMNSSIPGIYAAGDVAEGRDFFSGKPGINPILPNAIHQGRIAGSNMAGEKISDSGWISMNVLYFFGHHAGSIGTFEYGVHQPQILREFSNKKRKGKELIFLGDRLIGARFLNVNLDPGVILYLIENRLEIGSYKEALFQDPLNVGRWLMLQNEHEKGVILKY
jgi:phenylglyoxylate dehydrogenase epsilon subunit